MRTPDSALLLIGSPKPGPSSSASLGSYLQERLAARGIATETVVLTKALKAEEATQALLAAVAAADLVVLSFPLYVDSLPAPVIRALELIADSRAARAADAHAPHVQAPDASGLGAPEQPGFLTICQCGFPEAEHNLVALEICANFARAAGFEWAGGLAMGGGGLIDGRPLGARGGLLRSVTRALDLSAAELAGGRPAPAEAVRLMSKAAFPAFAYRFVANRGWRADLRKRGAATPLDARPYA
jgi:hypothetical protein